MKEIYRSNNLVKLSYLQSLLRDAGIEAIIMDNNMSIMQGSISAIQQRLMVIEEDESLALRIFEQSDVESI